MLTPPERAHTIQYTLLHVRTHDSPALTLAFMRRHPFCKCDAACTLCAGQVVAECRRSSCLLGCLRPVGQRARRRRAQRQSEAVKSLCGTSRSRRTRKRSDSVHAQLCQLSALILGWVPDDPYFRYFARANLSFGPSSCARVVLFGAAARALRCIRSAKKSANAEEV